MQRGRRGCRLEPLDWYRCFHPKPDELLGHCSFEPLAVMVEPKLEPQEMASFLLRTLDWPMHF